MTESPWMSLKEAASYVRKSERWLWGQWKNGNIASHQERENCPHVFHVSDLDALMTGNRKTNVVDKRRIRRVFKTPKYI